LGAHRQGVPPDGGATLNWSVGAHRGAQPAQAVADPVAPRRSVLTDEMSYAYACAL